MCSAVQNLLVQKLREQERDSQGIVQFGVNEVAGMTQHDLINWYLTFQAERCATLKTQSKFPFKNSLQSVVLCVCCKHRQLFPRGVPKNSSDASRPLPRPPFLPSNVTLRAPRTSL